MTFNVTNTFTAGDDCDAAEINANFADIEAELNSFPGDGVLDSGSITTAKLASEAVTFAKIAGAVVETYAEGLTSTETSVPTSKAVVEGAEVMHDSQGGYQNCDVNGSKTKVYTKYLTGTLPAAATHTVAHGVTTGISKLLMASVCAFNDGIPVAAYMTNEQFQADSAIADGYYAGWDNTNIVFRSMGTNIQGNAYRIRIDYIL